MSIGAINNNMAPNMSELFKSDNAEVSEKLSFSSFLKDSVGEVNNLLNAADKAQADLMMGKSENLHESMIASEKAETALKFMMQVRTKAIEAYNDILKMQL